MPVINLAALRNFISSTQLAALRSMVRSEEGEFFGAKLIELSERVKGMPKVYEQDGKGDAAVAHLHYFNGNCDWYITERDFSDEQLQAFGLASLHGEYPEIGYISIAELIRHGVEIDLHFKPTPLGELKRQRAAA